MKTEVGGRNTDEILGENRALKSAALDIIEYAVKKADPYLSTLDILRTLGIDSDREVVVLSVGKAAVPMAKAAQDAFGDRIKRGLIVTKYGHSKGFSSEYFDIIESAHPVSDENSVKAAEKGLEIVRGLKDEICIVLLSGGGSALLEKSSVPFEVQRDITKKLLARGAEIEEINAVRRTISLVKGGRLAAAAYPAKVITVALSDVLGNNKTAIASGITVAEPPDKAELGRIAEKYLPEYRELLEKAADGYTDIKINDGGYFFAGDINSLCQAAEDRAEQLGFTVAGSSRSLTGEAREVAKRLIAEVKDKSETKNEKRAYIYGGETTVTLKGDGLGGRNQEMALAAAIELKDRKNIVFASAGSDGTDGPTDAAGGIADGETFAEIEKSGLDPYAELENNNSYYALKAASALIVTGPTGTNVNDLSVLLTVG